MGKNGAKSQGEFIELAGWEIKKVKEGLDETQVTSLINELVSQRDQLNERTEHLSSLTNLAERTVTEADKLAEEMKTKAIEQAKDETASLIAEAETKAQEIESEIKKVQLELRSTVQGILSQLLTEPANEAPVDTQEPTPTTNQSDSAEETKEEPEKVPASNEQETTLSDGNLDLELEILPPLDIMKIMEIVTYLDNLPEVENTELIPNTERPSITVSLREPIELTGMLSTLPEVANIEEDKSEPSSEGKPRKLQISLSLESVAQEAQKA